MLTPTHPSTAANPHCPDHPTLTQGCESCARAQAAFAPYKMVGRNDPPRRPYLQFTSTFVPGEASLSETDEIKFLKFGLPIKFVIFLFKFLIP